MAFLVRAFIRQKAESLHLNLFVLAWDQGAQFW